MPYSTILFKFHFLFKNKEKKFVRQRNKINNIIQQVENFIQPCIICWLKKIGSHISTGSYKLILALSAFPGRLQPSIIDVLDFTSVFEMGTGVSPKLYAPEIL